MIYVLIQSVPFLGLALLPSGHVGLASVTIAGLDHDRGEILVGVLRHLLPLARVRQEALSFSFDDFWPHLTIINLEPFVNAKREFNVGSKALRLQLVPELILNRVAVNVDILGHPNHDLDTD